MRRETVLSLLISSLFLCLGGCCHPPVKKISMAKAQLIEAREVGAPQYVPEKYKEAEDILSRAEAESRGECRKSWSTAELAVQKVKELKEETLTAMEQAKADGKTSIEQAQKHLKAAEKAESLQYAPDLYEAASSSLQQAQKAFQQKLFLKAKDLADKATKLALRAKEAAIKVKKELAATITKPSTYIVRSGDCLWIIAGYPQIYNNPYMWPLIYWANKAQTPDPDLIYAGQVLVIPRDFSAQEKEHAIFFTKHRGHWSIYDEK